MRKYITMEFDVKLELASPEHLDEFLDDFECEIVGHADGVDVLDVTFLDYDDETLDEE